MLRAKCCHRRMDRTAGSRGPTEPKAWSLQWLYLLCCPSDRMGPGSGVTGPPTTVGWAVCPLDSGMGHSLFCPSEPTPRFTRTQNLYSSEVAAGSRTAKDRHRGLSRQGGRPCTRPKPSPLTPTAGGAGGVPREELTWEPLAFKNLLCPMSSKKCPHYRRHKNPPKYTNHSVRLRQRGAL